MKKEKGKGSEDLRLADELCHLKEEEEEDGQIESLGDSRMKHGTV